MKKIRSYVLYSMLVFSVCFSFAQKNSLLQKKFDDKLDYIDRLSGEGKLEIAIEEAEKAKAFAYKNFKGTNNKKRVLYKLNSFYGIIENYDKELETNIEFYRLRAQDDNEETTSFTKSFKTLSQNYLNYNDDAKIIDVFEKSNETLLKMTESVFRERFEDHRGKFLKRNIVPFLDLFHSFAFATRYEYSYYNNLLTNNVLVTKGALLNSSKDILKNLEELNDNSINKKIGEFRKTRNFVSYQLSLDENMRSEKLAVMQGRLFDLESELVYLHRIHFKKKISLKKNWRLWLVLHLP